MTFKVGDTVRVVSASGYDEEYGITNSLVSEIVKINGRVIYLKSNPARVMYEYQLKKVNKTIRDVEVGDIVVNSFNSKARVLVVTEEILVVGLDMGDVMWYTLKGVEKLGWTIYEEPSEVIEVNGKKYNKEAVEERLKELKTVE